ncbi:conjugal transfer protein [Pseudomonas flexibilis]|uniref:Conjugative transfer region lipoprotein, TIGR03751 family n=1 Tax=Pseudomonas flexibilis TaxID=706570 RepID=A0A1N7AEE4_9PSED|nr:TIGR03751 family conjugal transfer lipoprotein [Pseudomonas flexibilis]KHL69385.1 conjugal transfer protein [Pseudomonas flexibilis]SIR37438.1 conjugative transfer region lipoprotein, TIGR03751 family [Pseudomonas flexibilis]
MPKSLRPYLTWISLLALLQGCAGDAQTLLPPGAHDMQAIWNGATSGHTTLHEARLALRRPIHIEPAELQQLYTRSAANELRSQFPRLPNPDLVLYVFPHLAGSEQAPVPGYSTVFPFYRQVHYALPGERLEAY